MVEPLVDRAYLVERLWRAGAQVEHGGRSY